MCAQRRSVFDFTAIWGLLVGNSASALPYEFSLRPQYSKQISPA